MTTRNTPKLSSDGFNKNWLALREPADHVARSHYLATELSLWANSQDRIDVLELGAGTGSNLRYLAPRLGHNQRWTLVDNDEALLSALPEIITSWATSNNAKVMINGEQLNLRADSFSVEVNSMSSDLAQDLSSLPFETVNLVTASALLDLASANWLDQLVEQCVTYQCTVLFALSYNGFISWNPQFDEDETFNKRLNDHQLNNKGFGPALGPGAAHYLEKQMQAAGRSVQTDQSNWNLSRKEHELQSELISGWVKAVSEQDHQIQALAQTWKSKRLGAINDPAAMLSVGHTDLLSFSQQPFESGSLRG